MNLHSKDVLLSTAQHCPGALLVFLLLPWISITDYARAAEPQTTSGDSAAVADSRGVRRAMWGVETRYEEAAAIDGPLRESRSKFWNGKSGQPSLSDESTPSALDYAQTHKHAAAVEGLPKSAAVIVGSVKNARSYLSSDKTTIYTEMLITVKSVLWDRSGLSLANGSSISVTRAGGVVRLPSGKLLIRGC